MTNPVIDCLLNHRSIRKFKSTPIDPETLDLILRSGIRAATAGNLQHYSLIVVDDIHKKRALEDSPMANGATIVVAVVDEYRIKRWLELNDAPFYFDRAINLFIGYWDAIIALHNVVIAAESLGLGTVYIGDVLSYDLGEILDIPEYVFPAGMVLIGYPDEAPALQPRLPLEAVVHHNGYHIPTDDEVMSFYYDKDLQWDNLSEEKKRALLSHNIHNTAQRVTLGHYTQEFIDSDTAALLENLRRAKFKLVEGD